MVNELAISYSVHLFTSWNQIPVLFHIGFRWHWSSTS